MIRPWCRGFIFVVSLTFFSTQPLASSAGTTGVLAGFVLTSSGAPLQSATGAAVSPSQTAATGTDKPGLFVFAALSPDEYSLIVSKEGYVVTTQRGLLVTA